jgi:hypothetical protein
MLMKKKCGVGGLGYDPVSEFGNESAPICPVTRLISFKNKSNIRVGVDFF